MGVLTVAARYRCIGIFIQNSHCVVKHALLIAAVVAIVHNGRIIINQEFNIPVCPNLGIFSTCCQLRNSIKGLDISMVKGRAPLSISLSIAAIVNGVGGHVLGAKSNVG